MALIECNECGKKISSTATSCPACGAPATPRQDDKPLAATKTQIGWVKKVLIVAFWVIVGLLAYEMFGGRMSNKELSTRVKASMQESFRSDPELAKYNLSITDLTVVNLKGNQYEGLANVSYDGESHPLSVKIAYDGESFVWNVDAISFNFLAEVVLQQQYQELDEQIDAVSKQIEDGMRSYRERNE
ncbi:zinc ribbon domain-containing protein [Stutzerimonas nitrititolerans]|jgi:hypothetical protein|uniref:zinc ribbon domain-containing protein n=1 Tax=Stutzerimonas nitrititolerans TaxID=2482751 RepID=UPI0028A7439C|nr:zinc ribbon domain-containing protein [Stutzerimonas nitrititolerans]